MPYILTTPSKALCRLICDPMLGKAPDIVSPGLALRNNLSRACFAMSHWKALNFEVGDGVNISTYARRFLECSTTALLLRVDPLRVLALKELQIGSSYHLSKKNLLSIQWSGDILSKEPIKATTALSDIKPSDLDRALFSTLCSKVIWKPAVEELQTYLTTNTTNTAWQLDFLRIDPDQFARTIAGQLNESFSFFSKGIHSEWVDRRRTRLNSADCRHYIGKAVKNISFCAASLCCSSAVRHQLESQKILAGLIDIENEFGVF